MDECNLHVQSQISMKTIQIDTQFKVSNSKEKCGKCTIILYNERSLYILYRENYINVMEEYIKLSVKKSKNDYPHDPERYYPYGYTESAVDYVEKEGYADKVVIKFCAPHENEELHLDDMGGDRTGCFSLMQYGDGSVSTIMKGEMVKGLVDGYCQIYDPYGDLIFEGSWSEGKRNGTCIEYEYGSVSFQGTYRNDKRNGYGWEYHENELQREGEWVDGVYQQVYKLVWEDNFVGNGLGMCISSNNDLLITTVKWEDGKCNGQAFTYSKNANQIIQERLYMHGDDIDVSPVAPPTLKAGTLQLPDGTTWKGTVSMDQATGEGELYDADNKLIYRGSMFRNARYGHGISYHPNGQPSYDGLWSRNVRMGDGKSFDSRGTVEHEGVWINDEFATSALTIPNDADFVHSTVLLRELRIGDNALNSIIEVDFQQYSLLESFEVGSHSLQEVTELNFSNLQRLRSIHLGEDSCTLCVRIVSPATVAKENIALRAKTLSMNENRVREEMKRMVITDCPLLESVVLERNACSDFLSFVIEETPRLKELRIGRVDSNGVEESASLNFFYCDTLELIGLPALETLELGNRTFYNVKILRLHDLTSLKSFQFGHKSCFGKKERTLDHLVNSSRMSIANLPVLETMRFHNNFVFFSKCSFENIPNCKEVEIRGKTFPERAFPIEIGENVSEEVKAKVVNSK